MESSKEKLVEGVASVWDESADKTTEAYNDVSSWVYKHFSKAELAKLLGKKDNDDDYSHSVLVKELQDKFATSGKSYYPDDGLFENWSDKDLEEILTTRNIPFDKTAKRTGLLATLRRNLRYVYLQGEKTVSELGDKLDFSSRDFFDKSGQFTSSVFTDWSDDDLKLWLSQNDLLKKPVNSYSRRDLIKIARKNTLTLKNDIDTYIAYKSAHAQPFLSKATQSVSDAYDNIVDTTFNLWTGSRLEQFLNSRNVPIPKSATHEQLLELARKSKDQASNTFGSWTFDQWSTDNLKAWLAKHHKNAEGTREDLVKSASEYLSSAHKDAVEGGQQILNSVGSTLDEYKKAAFDTWNDNDLRSYVESYGVKDTSKWSHKELVKNANANYELFTTGYDPRLHPIKHHCTKAFSKLRAVGAQIYYSAAIYGLKFRAFFDSLYRSFFNAV